MKTFEEWMGCVDVEIGRIVGLSSMDLADQPFRDWYDDNITPHEAAVRTLKYEGYECE